MFRTPSCFLLIGGIIAALSLLGLLMVTEPDTDKEKPLVVSGVMNNNDVVSQQLNVLSPAMVGVAIKPMVR